MKAKFTISVICLILFSINLKGQNRILEITLAGIVLSEEDNQPIPNVEIINTATGKGTTTDTIGFFKLRILPGDSILFKSVGYETNYLNMFDTLSSTVYFMTIKLSMATYELQVVNIYALSRQNQFRYDFIHMQPDDEWGKQLIIPGVTRSQYQMIRPEEKMYPVSSLSPISFLYYKFSKEEKSLRKLAELKAEDQQEEENRKKFNKELLQSLTQYKGAKLDSFYYYLHFSDSFMASKTSYELLMMAKEKMTEFEVHFISDTVQPIIPLH